jgi:hypothetical protein
MKKVIAICLVLIVAGAALAGPRDGRRTAPRPTHPASLIAFLAACGLTWAHRDCICTTHHVAFAQCWHEHGRWERHVRWYAPHQRGRHYGWNRHDEGRGPREREGRGWRGEEGHGRQGRGRH